MQINYNIMSPMIKNIANMLKLSQIITQTYLSQSADPKIKLFK